MLAISQESLQTVADHHVKVKMAALEEVMISFNEFSVAFQASGFSLC